MDSYAFIMRALALGATPGMFMCCVVVLGLIACCRHIRHNAAGSKHRKLSERAGTLLGSGNSRSRPIICVDPTLEVNLISTGPVTISRLWESSDWEQHRSPMRFFKSCRHTALSTTLFMQRWNLLAVAIWSTAITVITLTLGYPGPLEAPSLPFELATIFISLQLVFRTDMSYQRLHQARTLFEELTAESKSIARIASWHIPADLGQQRMMCMCNAFTWCAMAALRGWADVGKEHVQCFLQGRLEQILTASDVELLLTSVADASINPALRPPSMTLWQVTGIIAKATKEKAAAEWVLESLQKQVDGLGATFAKCERLRTTPMPASFSHHGHRCLVAFMFGLPFVLCQACGAATPFFCTAIAFMAFGIDELGSQIEEPFCVLPLMQLCLSAEEEIKQMHLQCSCA